ncbi:ATP synthase subunit I [Pseudoalteromonas luteoviolacea]|uniref:ATP synthase F1F0 n=1 Tax=Pseudoalteromonas luteoviolacea S4060-1 TaxID=1365257 RepID=A0A167J219_9GAMM|nr:ATP synthase subunit I [Pseudoalteromonas luteoviolacea]KZN35960.1 ATP synthase F1F0 [Pseudoalteromonas luteoviolacea S2607]KZN60411.1 ATP synthase F1F0 [Pseudoalteromonas luteoviolacea S4060-1]
MTHSLAGPYRRAALKGVLLQGIVALFAAVIVLVGWGAQAGLSALMGGVAIVLPNFVFALYAFRYVGASKAEQVYDSLKRGKGLKFLLTICIFALVFKHLSVMALPFFCCYILVMFSQWLAPIFFNH